MTAKKQATNVNIVDADKAIPVKVEGRSIENKKSPMQPTTTLQEDITTAGQRKVNLIWEFTQATVALLITGAFVYCETFKVDSIGVRMAFSLVIGFYFSRTNHQAIGGVGKQPTQRYQGR